MGFISFYFCRSEQTFKAQSSAEDCNIEPQNFHHNKIHKKFFE